MSYRFVGHLQGLEPIPGIPLECPDAEFEAAAADHESQFGPEAKGSLKKSGLYEHVKDPKPKDEEG